MGAQAYRKLLLPEADAFYKTLEGRPKVCRCCSDALRLGLADLLLLAAARQDPAGDEEGGGGWRCLQAARKHQQGVSNKLSDKTIAAPQLATALYVHR